MTYKLVRAFIAALVATLVVAAGCGRSDLINTEWDGSLADVHNEGGACDANSCPTGCCDASGTCRTGTELNTCGYGGQTCNDCQAQHFDFCDSQVHACGNVQPTCDITTCAAGCCTLFNGQNACVSGVSSLACGSSGNKCSDCTTNGQVCDPTKQACVDAPCGPNNCKGCCQGTKCVNTETDTQCGLGGLACTDCTLKGLACNSGTCASACNPKTCVGCCQTGTCFAGFLDTRCGSAGATCADCTAVKSTCDTIATPRVCKGSTTTCPATYSSCPSTVTTPTLSVNKGQCSSSDLSDAKAGCALGFNSTACQSFFTTEASINPACAKCLTPFQFAFQDGTGIFNCVSPYVSSTCNHDTGCIDDCETKSCEQCPPSSVQSCRQQVAQSQCSTYITGASCIATALFGTASFCSPQTYSGNYGAWLAGVGAHYCE